jgi:hypothetical protein
VDNSGLVSIQNKIDQVNIGYIACTLMNAVHLFAKSDVLIKIKIIKRIAFGLVSLRFILVDAIFTEKDALHKK